MASAIQEGRYITRFIAGENLPLDVPTRRIVSNWIARDPTTFEGMRLELLDRIRALPASLGVAITGKKIHWGHLMTFLGMTFLQEGMELVLRMPDVRGDLHDVTYRVERVFQLVPNWWNVRVEVYGLTPKGNSPHLLFFSGSQNVIDLMADTTPLLSAGESLYRIGKRELLQWIQGKEVHAFGESLGAAIACQLAMDCPQRIFVHAYVPPGLLPWTIKGPMRGVAYIDPDDLISKCYLFPPGLKLVHIKRAIPGNHFYFWHHLQLFSPPPDQVFHPVESEQFRVSSRRVARTVIYQLSCCVVFPLLLMTYLIYLPTHFLASGKIRSKL